MAEPLARFDFHFDPPIEGLSFAVDRFADGISDFSGLFGTLSGRFQAGMRKQFASQGGWGAGGWADLSPAYDAWKREHYPGRPIGVLRGYLRNAMTGGSGYMERIGKDAAEFGMADSSKAVQYGRHFAERRPVVALPREEVRAWQEDTHRWLHDEAKAAGWGMGSWPARGLR